MSDDNSQRKIFKFHIPIPMILLPDETQTPAEIEMPKGAKIISAHSQHNNIYIWAECDPAAPREDRKFFAISTDWDIPPNIGKFIGTVVLDQYYYVFHIYDAE